SSSSTSRRATASSKGSRSSSTRRPTRRRRATPSSRSATRPSRTERSEDRGTRTRRAHGGALRMNLEFTLEQEAFRAEVRAWLVAHVPKNPLPSMDTAEGFRLHREWERELHDGGYAMVSWPV